MDLFNEEFKKEYLKYHHNPMPPNSLDPRVWYFPDNGAEPRMLPGIKSQIIRDIDYINSAEQEYVKTRVWDYFVTGPIVQEGSTNKCSINIIVQIDPTNLSDILKERILNVIKDLNGKLAVGTTHPIYYIPTLRKVEPEKYYALYHPYTEKWIKKPRFLGEAKNSLKDLTQDTTKRKPKQSLKKGLRRLTTI